MSGAKPGKIRIFVAILGCAVAFSGLLSANAHAALTFDVEVGRFLFEDDPSAEAMRFFPSTIKIVPGDTLHFSARSVHGVTVLPAGIEPSDWVDAYAGPGGAWGTFMSDPDEGKSAVKFNPRIVLPSHDCGWDSQAACQFDGSGDPALDALNSGLAFTETADGLSPARLSFSVTITADPGSVLYALDPVHPEMFMRIEMVGSFEERSTIDALENAIEERFSADQTRARQLDKAYSKKRVKKTVRGVTTWQAWAGVEEEGISLRRFYPKKLTIEARDKVKWVFSKNIYEAHTVVFPRSKATDVAQSFPEFVCDPDGDADGAEADTSPTSTSFPYCSSLEELEIDVPRALAIGTGDRKVTKASDLESSGVRGASFAESKSPYTLSFTRRSKAAGYTYACAVHPAFGMQGTVVVTR